MKVRNGFVSNSSSSSFIIALPPKVPCSYCGRADPDILDEIGQLSDGSSYTVVRAIGYERVIHELGIPNYPPDDPDAPEEQLLADKISRYNNRGYRVAYISVSNHNIYLVDKIRSSIIVLEDLS
jgi:hypothetical protein